MCIGPPIQWFNDPPCGFSISFKLSPLSGVATKTSFSNGVSTGNMFYETLLHFLSLLPNNIEWYYWFYGLFDQCWYHVRFGWCWYWGASVLDLIRRHSQRVYQNLWLVFQRKPYYVLPWGYHLFLIQECIYMFYESIRRHHSHTSFWLSSLWWI